MKGTKNSPDVVEETKIFSGITNWGELSAQVTIVMELTDGEVSSMGAIINGSLNGVPITGEAELAPVIE